MNNMSSGPSPSPHLQKVYRAQGVYSETGRGPGPRQTPPIGALSEDGGSRPSLSRSQCEFHTRGINI